jgi:hypothetical protein
MAKHSQPMVPAFGSMRVWCERSGVGRAKSYEMLAARQLRAVKNGRSLLIDIPHGLKFLSSLPPAEIRPRTAPRRRSAPKEEPETTAAVPAPAALPRQLRAPPGPRR